MREDELYKRYVQPRLSDWGDCCRVENTVDSGMPDVNYAIEDTHGWLELKVTHGGLYHFERFQLPWLKRRARHSKDVWVLALHDRKAVVRLHSVSQLFEVELGTKKKWTTMDAEDVPFVLELKLQSDWQQLRQVLTQAHN